MARLLQWLRFKLFGLRAYADSEHDATKALQQTIDRAIRRGEAVRFPPGTFRVTGTVYWRNRP
jgi:polygalacturonase